MGGWVEAVLVAGYREEAQEKVCVTYKDRWLAPLQPSAAPRLRSIHFRRLAREFLSVSATISMNMNMNMNMKHESASMRARA